MHATSQYVQLPRYARNRGLVGSLDARWSRPVSERVYSKHARSFINTMLKMLGGRLGHNQLSGPWVPVRNPVQKRGPDGCSLKAGKSGHGSSPANATPSGCNRPKTCLMLNPRWLIETHGVPKLPKPPKTHKTIPKPYQNHPTTGFGGLGKAWDWFWLVFGVFWGVLGPVGFNTLAPGLAPTSSG